MHTASLNDDGHSSDGLPEPLDAQITNDTRYPKEAFKMRNTQNAPSQETKNAYIMKTSLSARDSMRAVLDVVSFELHLKCPESVTNS